MGRKNINGNATHQVLIDFYSQLSRISLPEASITYVPPGTQVISYGEENKVPLLNICSPKVDANFFFALLEQVGEVVIAHYPYLETECRQVISALPSDASGREVFVDKVFKPGTDLLALLQSDVSPDTFGFLLSHTVKPLMKQFGQMTSAIYNLEAWMQGACPVCGGKPSLSLLEKEQGKRYLYCGLCEVKWRFHRLGCPHCASQESQFIQVEGEDKYRIYYCDHCSGYIKTIDERKTGGAVDLFWEDIYTVHLDILALRAGYVNAPVGLPLSPNQNMPGN